MEASGWETLKGALKRRLGGAGDRIELVELGVEGHARERIAWYMDQRVENKRVDGQGRERIAS